MKRTLRHRGFYEIRLLVSQNNPRERAFARQWEKEQAQGHILQHLIECCSQRDASVAATVIQWLGSNVGMSFLEEVIRESEEVRRYLRERAFKE